MHEQYCKSETYQQYWEYYSGCQSDQGKIRHKNIYEAKITIERSFSSRGAQLSQHIIDNFEYFGQTCFWDETFIFVVSVLLHLGYVKLC